MKSLLHSILLGTVLGGLVEMERPHGCMKDCAWAIGCTKCYECFADPEKSNSTECVGCMKQCVLAWGCMECLNGGCDGYNEKCPDVKNIAPCFKNPTLPGCPDLGSGDIRQCGLGLACEADLFDYIKKSFSPCDECIQKCSVCKPCLHCLDDPNGAGCDECQQCEPCTGCAACVQGACPAYSKCQDCTLCLPCLTDPTSPGCDKCTACEPCIRAIGCFDDTKNFAKLIFGKH